MSASCSGYFVLGRDGYDYITAPLQPGVPAEFSITLSRTAQFHSSGYTGTVPTPATQCRHSQMSDCVFEL